MKYGRLVVVGDEGLTRDKHKCRCDCGAIVFVELNRLRSGNTRSCGCLQKETASKMFRKHYGKGTVEYTSWQLMKDRCYNENNKTFAYYGGKGVRVCERWRNSFENFLSDMGLKPGGSYTLDRINGDADYSRDNCRWATKKEQTRNRGNTKMINYKGERRPLAEWCEILQIDYNNTNKRIWRGWSTEDAFEKPKKGRYL